jgi:D-alanine-D-alanine ligase
VACAQAVSAGLGKAGYDVALLPFSGDVELALADYSPSEWLVFNLAEGMAGRLFEEPRIAWALEAMGFSFTGSGGEALARCLNKARTKELLATHGVSTPRWWLLRHAHEVDAREAEFMFPLIVKPVAEDASIGLDGNAVVHTHAALRQRVAYVVERYRQSALVEAFIVGREFNVALWGNPPTLLPLAEIDFSAFSDPFARIVSFAAKWEEESFEYNNTPALCPAPVNVFMHRRITSAALRAWEAIGCRGYARVDMRLSEKGTPYVVEVNCNPDISPDAGFFRAARTAGYSYEDMAAQIVEIARSQVYVEDRTGLAVRRGVHPAADREGRRVQPDRSGVRGGTLERVSG